MTTNPGVPSLTEYAKARGTKGAKAPWMETLPPEVLAEVVAAWKEGIRGTPIVEWLKAKGFEDATNSRVTGYCAQRYK